MKVVKRKVTIKPKGLGKLSKPITKQVLAVKPPEGKTSVYETPYTKHG